MGKTCQICGKSSGMYPLCREHLEMKAKGAVIKCDNCGRWHLAGNPCQCQSKVKYTTLPTEGFEKCIVCDSDTNGYAFCKKCFKKYTESEMLNMLNSGNSKPINENTKDDSIPKTDNIQDSSTASAGKSTTESNNVIVVDFNNKSRCITCGKQTDGWLFCANCYQKYKNKELLFRITNCTNVELLDEDYESKVPCKDGHVVKSKSEKFIDDYLFEHGIPHAYEKALFYGSSDKEALHPDFYLPNYLGKGKHVYIEHWGYNDNNIKYTKTKKFKMPIYKKLGITLICTYEKDVTTDIEAVLDRKLNREFIKENEINFEQ